MLRYVTSSDQSEAQIYIFLDAAAISFYNNPATVVMRCLLRRNVANRGRSYLMASIPMWLLPSAFHENRLWSVIGVIVHHDLRRPLANRAGHKRHVKCAACSARQAARHRQSRQGETTVDPSCKQSEVVKVCSG